MESIRTCLWFDGNADEAVRFYTSVIPNSCIIDTNHYLEGALRPAGDVLTIRFVLNGTEYIAPNATPKIPFTPAMSLVATCETQAEVDDLWRRLSDGGREGICGWLTDRYGVSWQIAPKALIDMIGASDRAAAQRAFNAMMKMTKLDIATLEHAYEGKP
jgi:predicted 3-demethylubiquinone-9 3-methyltransferase (glyoxalase superfamily)